MLRFQIYALTASASAARSSGATHRLCAGHPLHLRQGPTLAIAQRQMLTNEFDSKRNGVSRHLVRLLNRKD